MKIKRSLELRIRGWFPHDPLIRQQTTPPTKPTNTRRVNILNDTALVIIVLGALATFFLLSTSWIKSLLITVSIICGLTFLLARHRPRVKRIVKNTLVPVMLFALCFTALEACLFYNAGYPATYSSANPDTTISIENLGNVSVSEIIEKIEQSPAFSLLRLEHINKIKFYSMELNPINGGYVSVNFYSEDENLYFHFYSGNGQQYRLQSMPYRGTNSYDYLMSPNSTEQNLEQIDELGLNWFYNQALEIANNRTSTTPAVDVLNVNLTFGSHADYEGLSVQMIGYHQTVSESGTHGSATLISSFQPNGELIYMTVPV